MLKLTSKGLKDLAAVGGEPGFAGKRSLGTTVVSTAVGVGMVYVGARQASKHHNNAWHALTALGVWNLAVNASDLLNRGTQGDR